MMPIQSENVDLSLETSFLNFSGVTWTRISGFLFFFPLALFTNLTMIILHH